MGLLHSIIPQHVGGRQQREQARRLEPKHQGYIDLIKFSACFQLQMKGGKERGAGYWLGRRCKTSLGLFAGAFRIEHPIKGYVKETDSLQ